MNSLSNVKQENECKCIILGFVKWLVEAENLYNKHDHSLQRVEQLQLGCRLKLKCLDLANVLTQPESADKAIIAQSPASNCLQIERPRPKEYTTTTEISNVVQLVYQIITTSLIRCIFLIATVPAAVKTLLIIRITNQTISSSSNGSCPVSSHLLGSL